MSIEEIIRNLKRIQDIENILYIDKTLDKIVVYIGHEKREEYRMALSDEKMRLIERLKTGS